MSQRRFAPAAARNRDPIVEVLRGVLPARGTVLEIASGTGEHVVHFAEAFPDLVFQPSDPDLDVRESIAAWIDFANLTNVRAPLALDAASPAWEVPLDVRETLVALVCINMIHISPWTATLGLMRNAGQLLPSGGVLYLYGPYKRDDAHTAPSNAAFDASLRSRDPAWGVRDLDEVTRVAVAAGFMREAIVEMPANNLSVVFRRA